MARRDVELVIRARDEAKRALDNVSGALSKFNTAQKDTQKIAGDTDSQIDRLGAAIGGLQRQIKALNLGDALASEATKAAAALERVETANRDATAAAIAYKREAIDAARTVSKQKAALEGAAAALTRQKERLDQAKSAQKSLTSETKKASTAQAKYATEQRKLDGLIKAQQGELAGYRAELGALYRAFSQGGAAGRQAAAGLDVAAANIDKAKAKLEDLEETQRLVAAESDRAARAIAAAGDRFGPYAAQVDKLKASVKELTETQRGQAGAVRASIASQKQLEAAAESAAQAIGAQDAQLADAAASYAQVEAATKEVEEALRQVEAQVRGPMLKAFREQVERLKQTEAEFKANSVAAQQYQKELRETDSPSRALVKATEEYRAAAARGRQEVRAQREALQALRGVLRETGGDLDTFAGRQRRIAAILDSADSGYDQLAASTRRATEAQRTLTREQTYFTKETTKATTAARSQGKALGTAAAQGGLFAAALAKASGENRRALSYTQRLRAEVLSLVAAYGGLFAVIEGIQGVVEATKALDAAQRRLNVVFSGNQTAVASELDFIRRTAERLGVQFGALAGEYTKFAIATQGTNLEGAETRKIFTSITEAARVNGASLDDLKGVFVALTQIASKGVVSMEELRQQLGDRLPGAVNIMADALGVTSAELFDMVTAGEVTSDALSAFADEMAKRFGGEIPAAMQKTEGLIGKVQNAIFQTYLTIGKGGAIEGLNGLLRDLAETLKSPAFQDFAVRIGAALGGLFDVLAALVRNFDNLAIAAGAFAGLKLAPYVIALTTVLGRMPAILRLIRIRTVGVRAEMAGLSVSFRGAAAAAATFRAGLTALLSSTGIGLLVVGIGAAIGAWATAAEASTEAMAEHQKIVDEVRNAYDKAGDSVESWRKRLDSLTATQARANLQALQTEVERAADAFDDLIPDFDRRVPSILNSYVQSVEPLLEQFRDGQIDGKEFADEIDTLAEKYTGLRPEVDRLIIAIDKSARSVGDADAKYKQARDVLIALTGTPEEAAAALKRLSGQLEDTAADALNAAARTTKYREALASIESVIPGVKDALEEFKEAADLTDAFESARKLAQTYEELQAAFARYSDAQDALRAKKVFDEAASGGRGAAYALIAELERFQGTAKPDLTYRDGKLVNSAYRAGYGSDTTTLSDGTIVKIQKGMTVAFADAQRDLVRRIEEFQQGIKDLIGEPRFESFSDEQQAVLTSIAYNYGSLPARIVDAVRNGTTQEIATAIRGLQGDNGGINQNRRRFEASVFEAGGPASPEALIKAEEKRLETAKDVREEAEKLASATAARIAALKFEEAQGRLVALGLEKQARIQEELRAAKQENPNISSADQLEIAAQVSRNFDQEKAAELKEIEEDRVEAAEELKKATGERIADMAFEVEQAKRLLAGEETRAKVEENLRRARQENPAITPEELEAVKQNTLELLEQEALLEKQKETQEALARQDKERAEDAKRAREATQERLEDGEFEIRQQELINAGKERQAAIEAALRAARAENAAIGQADLDRIAAQTARLYDLTNAEKALNEEKEKGEKIEEKVNELLALQSALRQELAIALETGQDGAVIEQIRVGLEGVNEQLRAAIENALQLLEALNSQDPAIQAIISRLRGLQAQNQEATGEIVVSWTKVEDLFANGLTNAALSFAQGIAEGKSVTESARDAFLQFAADFLRSIAQMILQQIALNAVKAIGKALGFGVAHQGGVVGAQGAKRVLSADAFAGAVRYHTGGVAGLKPNEVPTVLERGEEVLTRDDPRHVFNGGGQNVTVESGDTRIINAIDGASFMEEALKDKRGGKVLLNYVRANSAAFKNALG